MTAVADQPAADAAIARPSLAALLVAWVLFRVLLMAVGLQDYLRSGHTAPRQPLLWEGSSCLLASAIVSLQWRRLYALDGLLARPRRWFAASLVWLPLAAPGRSAGTTRAGGAPAAVTVSWHSPTCGSLPMAYDKLMAALRAGDIVVLDGATGTELQRRGVPMDPASWSGRATLGNDLVLQAIHGDYIRAGARVVTANTFAASPLLLKAAGLAHRSGEIIERAVAAARAARDTTPGAQDVVVAGSLSHMVPVAAGTAVVDPGRVPSPAEIGDALHAVAAGLKSAGCELIILEMMYEPGRVKLALDAALATGLPVWFGISARRGAAGNAVSFHAFEELPISSVAGLIPAHGVDVAGVMHTGAGMVLPALEQLRLHFKGPLMAYPDSGYFEMPDWRFVDIISPARYQEFCVNWLRAGVQAVGGCCGLGVEHIEAASRARAIVLAERGRAAAAA